MIKGSNAGLEQGPQLPLGPIPSEASTSSAPRSDTLLQEQIHLKGEIAKVKQVLIEKKALNAKRHKDLLSALFALTARFASPSSSFPILLFILLLKHLVVHMTCGGL